MDNTWDFYSQDVGSIPARPANKNQDTDMTTDTDLICDQWKQQFTDARIQPYSYYIDRRIGIDPSRPKRYYLGKNWIIRMPEREFLMEVRINENGFFVETTNEATA